MFASAVGQQPIEKRVEQPQLSRVLPAGRRHQLHQPVRVRGRPDVGDEGRLLRDQRRDQIRIELPFGCDTADQNPSSATGRSPEHSRGSVSPPAAMYCG